MLFINLLFCKLQDVLILTTCFGHRMTIIRSTRIIKSTKVDYGSECVNIYYDRQTQQFFLLLTCYFVNYRMS